MEKLGILDWGIGGLGLYKSLKNKCSLSITYLSDAGYTPYGKVDRANLRERVLTCIQYLQSQDCSIIAIACNSAGSTIMDLEHPNIVKSGIHLIKSSDSTNIGVIGGSGTIKSELFMCDSNKSITQNVAQKMSAYIEAGTQDSKEAKNDLIEILKPLMHVDELLLACTHYAAISDLIANTFNDSCIILDPVEHLATNLLSQYQFSKEVDHIFTTGNVNQMKNAAKLAFNVDLINVKQLDINGIRNK
jgi:glutamate racemase